MAEQVAGFLVWRKGLNGFVPEKWGPSYQPPPGTPDPVARIPLNAAQFAMSIPILEQRFPCAAKLQDEVAR